MNTEPFTSPSPDLKQHGKDLKDHATQGAKDLQQDVKNVAQDVKKQANQGAQALKDEAGARFQDAQGKATDLIDSARAYASEHPVAAFGFGVLAGMILSSWRRR